MGQRDGRQRENYPFADSVVHRIAACVRILVLARRPNVAASWSGGNNSSVRRFTLDLSRDITGGQTRWLSRMTGVTLQTVFELRAWPTRRSVDDAIFRLHFAAGRAWPAAASPCPLSCQPG